MCGPRQRLACGMQFLGVVTALPQHFVRDVHFRHPLVTYCPCIDITSFDDYTGLFLHTPKKLHECAFGLVALVFSRSIWIILLSEVWSEKIDYLP